MLLLLMYIFNYENLFKIALLNTSLANTIILYYRKVD